MGDPIVYGPAYSTYARSVRLTLAEKALAKLPKLAAWWSRMKDRPSIKATEPKL